jgi:hypothetical protein
MDYDVDYAMQTELEAAVFRRLVAHLRQHTEVQNIDLMNVAGFCRNCLGNWLAEAANERGLPLTRDDGREKIYGMPYAEWKALNQAEASPEAKAGFEARAAEGPAPADRMSVGQPPAERALGELT